MGCPNFFKYHPEATIGDYCERFGYEEERLVETISGSAQFLVGRGTIKETLINLDNEKLTDTLYNGPDSGPIEPEHVSERPESAEEPQNEGDKPEEEEPEYRIDYTSEEEEEEEDKLKDYKEEESGEEVLFSNLFRQIGLADELYSFC